MKIGYFPGCSLHGTAIEYNESLINVCSAFGYELEEIKDWNCCGATAAHSLNKMLSIALPARTLALAEKQGYDEILVPCAACYSRMLTAWHEIKTDEKLKKQIPELIEMEYHGTAKPMSILDFISKYIAPNLKDKVVTPLNKTVACYYGCLLVRPNKLVNFDRYEDPTAMEEILTLIGAKPIDWAFKTECCGAGMSVPRTDIVGKLSGKILEDASHRGAEAIIAACPMCQSNLDMRRKSIDLYLGEKIEIPVLYITQAIGLAIGISGDKLGTGKHFVKTDKFISQINIIKDKKTVTEAV